MPESHYGVARRPSPFSAFSVSRAVRQKASLLLNGSDCGMENRLKPGESNRKNVRPFYREQMKDALSHRGQQDTACPHRQQKW
jgi:hypothetical protein